MTVFLDAPMISAPYDSDPIRSRALINVQYIQCLYGAMGRSEVTQVILATGLTLWVDAPYEKFSRVIKEFNSACYPHAWVYEDLLPGGVEVEEEGEGVEIFDEDLTEEDGQDPALSPGSQEAE